MSYCTLSDIQQRVDDRLLIELTDPARAAIQTAVVTEAAASVSGLIDTYLRPRYGVHLPLESPPAEIVEAACVLALYWMYSRRGIDEESAEQTVGRNKTDTLTWLRDISSGKAELNLDAPESADIKISARDQVFTDSVLAEYGE